jgi:hypothetical protein
LVGWKVVDPLLTPAGGATCRRRTAALQIALISAMQIRIASVTGSACLIADGPAS